MIDSKSEMSARVLQALQAGRSSILLREDDREWSGESILDRVREMHEAIIQASHPGARVGIGFPNSAAQAIAILATLIADRVPVVLSSLDLRADPVVWLDRSGASFFISAVELEESLDGRAPFISVSKDASIRTWRPGSFHGAGQGAGMAGPSPPNTGRLVLFTSGSTGEPKGILLPEAGLLRTADYLIRYFGLSSTTVSPILLPICHSMALNTQFLPTLLAGGQSCFLNPRLSLNRLYREILSCRGTLVSLIGETLRICWDEKTRKGLPSATHVENVQLAGGFITPRHLTMARELFPGAVLHKGYGLTEAIRVSMISSLEPGFETTAVGKPLPFVTVEIRGPERKIDAPGEIGEIHVHGPNVTEGALSPSRPGPLAGNQLQDLRDERGFLATGDFGFWNGNGQLCIAGRKDSLFKVNGQRVSGLEIERAALNSSPRIRNAKCVAVENEVRGGYRMLLYLEVEGRSSHEGADAYPGLDSAWLRELHRRISSHFQSLPHFPREIILLPRFPRTSNGKVAVRKLIESTLECPRILLLKEPRSRIQFFGLSEAANERMAP